MKNRSRCHLIVLSCCCCCWTLGWSTCSEGDPGAAPPVRGDKEGPISKPEPEVRFLAAGMEDGRRRLRLGSAVVTCTEWKSREWLALLAARIPGMRPPTGDAERSRSATWRRRKGDLDVLVDLAPQTGKQQLALGLREVRLVTSGEEARVLYHYVGKDGSRYRGVRCWAEDVLTGGVWREHADMDPLYHAYYSYDKPLDEELLSPESKVTYKGEETVDGSRCMKVAVRSKSGEGPRLEYWIDLQHGFCVRRRRWYESLPGGAGEYLQRAGSVREFVPCNGAWLPRMVEYRHFVPPRLLPHLRGAAIIRRFTFSEVAAELDETDEVHQLQWPPGTLIDDHVADSRVVVPTGNVGRGGEKPPDTAGTGIPETPASEEAGGALVEGQE